MMRFLPAFGLSLLLAACASAPKPEVEPEPEARVETPQEPDFSKLTQKTLTPFASARAYRDWLDELEALQAASAQGQYSSGGEDIVVTTGASTSSESAPAPVVASGPNITNVQNAGVDEGDIVKQVGDHLVLMQDGRLFSVAIGSGTPRLVAREDIYERPGAHIWYDELLVSGRRLVVTGYSYEKQATEIVLYDLRADGTFDRQGTWYLSSNDYYSGDNSATRLVGDTLIFHTQRGVDTPEKWPTIRRADRKTGQAMLEPIGVYPPLLPYRGNALHTVSECALSAGLACTSRAVIAPWNAEWVVSDGNGWLWVGPGWGGYSREAGKPSTLYRFPLGSEDVEAAFIDGDLPSRFAFEVRGDRAMALVSQEIPGHSRARPGLHFVDFALSDLSDRPEALDSNRYTLLPGEGGWGLKQRFAATHLVYAPRSDYDARSATAYAVDLESPATATRIDLSHRVQRLDRVGRDAVLIGPRPGADERADLALSWLDLDSAPTVTDRLTLRDRVEAEGRAQALNMRVAADGSALLGLPTHKLFRERNSDYYDYDAERGTDISFVDVSAFGQLSSLGPAKGDPSRIDPTYDCETSCVDWYGNARPFFIGDRIFALIASELIELREGSGRMFEVSRLNLSAPPN